MLKQLFRISLEIFQLQTKLGQITRPGMNIWKKIDIGQLLRRRGGLESWVGTRLELFLSINQIYYSITTRLRTRPCATRLVEECWVWTPIWWSLKSTRGENCDGRARWISSLLPLFFNCRFYIEKLLDDILQLGESRPCLTISTIIHVIMGFKNVLHIMCLVLTNTFNVWPL